MQRLRHQCENYHTGLTSVFYIIYVYIYIMYIYIYIYIYIFQTQMLEKRIVRGGEVTRATGGGGGSAKKTPTYTCTKRIL